MHTQKQEIKVRATRDFTIGPRRRVAIHRGSERVVVIGDHGFWTTPDDGRGYFGWCKIGDGWEKVEP